MTRRILLVDDDSAVRRMLLRVLGEEHYLVQAARTGQEGLNLAAAEEFGLLVLDVNLPGEDGWAICEKFLKAHPDLAIIVLIARLNRDLPFTASRVAAVMEKPLDIQVLLRTMDGLLRQDKPATAQSCERKSELSHAVGRNGIAG